MKFQKLHPQAVLPKQAKPGDAGYDLTAVADPTITPAGIQVYPTGVAVAVPDGHVGLIFDRSGVSTKRGFTRVAGVIDSSYRGEILVALAHVALGGGTLMPGERIAQLVVVPCVMEASEWVESLDETERGDSGFGSTGK